jgi:cobalamin synthase
MMESDTTGKPNGSGSILKDSKIGAIGAGLVTAVCLYIAQAVGTLDVTPLPDLLEPAATGLIATVSAWFLTKAAPRR